MLDLRAIQRLARLSEPDILFSSCPRRPRLPLATEHLHVLDKEPDEPDELPR